MATPNSSADPSRSSTPNPVHASRFTSQQATAEDLLKSHTVGLVQLSDFRKRRAEALEAKELETSGTSGVSTPKDGASTPKQPKKKRKPATKGKLSFALDDEEEEDTSTGVSAVATPKRSQTPDTKGTADEAKPTSEQEDGALKKRLGPNNNVKVVPKALTKAALLREAQARDQLRKEFLAMQERVKATEVVIPFVFYDGSNIPGGRCRVKKGDHVWLFLDKARKVGASLGVGGDGRGRRAWARAAVDDLLLVRGEIIIPHHYDFYYFLVNKSVGYNGRIFDYSDEPTSATPASLNADDEVNLKDYDPLAPKSKEKKTQSIDESQLEGSADDPTLTKVVNRSWYERNKHIYPASLWEEFDPEKDYTKEMRKDTQGNVFFF